MAVDRICRFSLFFATVAYEIAGSTLIAGDSFTMTGHSTVRCDG